MKSTVTFRPKVKLDFAEETVISQPEKTLITQNISKLATVEIRTQFEYCLISHI